MKTIKQIFVMESNGGREETHTHTHNLCITFNFCKNAPTQRSPHNTRHRQTNGEKKTNNFFLSSNQGRK